MKLRNRLSKHRSFWRLHPHIIPLLLLAFLTVPNAWGGTWDDLSKDAQDKVLAELEAGLPEGKAQEYSKLVRENIRDWSTYAGEISAGKYDNATNAVASKGAEYLSGKISDNLSGKAKEWYDLAAGYPGTAKQVGQAMLDPKKSWGDVGTIVWDKAITEMEASLAGKPKEWAISTLNHFFGSRSIGGYTPGDAYFALLDAWSQVVQKKAKEWKRSSINNAYGLYTKMRAEGASIDNIKDALIFTKEPPHNIRTYEFGMRNLGFSLDETIAKFREAEADGAVDFSSWLELSTSNAQNALDQAKADEKSKLHQALNGVRDKLVGNAKGHFAAIRTKLNQLIEKHLKDEDKKKLEEAKANARKLLGLYKNANARLQEACQTFDQSAAKAQQLIDQADELKQLAAQLGNHVKVTEEADKLNEETKKVIAQSGDLDQLEKDLVQSDAAIDAASDKACVESDKVGTATSKKDAKAALDSSIAAARDAQAAHKKGKQEIAAAKHKIVPLLKAVKDLQKSHDAASVLKIQSSLKAIEQTLAKTKDQKSMKSEFDAAKKAMQDALAAGQKNAEFMKIKKAEIEAALVDVKEFPSAAAMLEELTKEAANEGCIASKQKEWSTIKPGYPRWSNRQFPDKPFINDVLLKKAQAALKMGENLKNLEAGKGALTKIARKSKQLEQKLNELNSMKFAYEICVANAILAYNEKWLKYDEAYGKAQGELDKARNAADLAEAAMKAAQQAATAVSNAVSKVKGVEGAVSAGEAAASSASQKCTEARDILSQVTAASQAGANTKSNIESCYNSSNTKFKESCQAAAGLQNVSKMSLEQIQSLASKAKSAAGSSRAAASTCDSFSKMVASQAATAESANRKLKGLLAEIAQLQSKMSAAPGKISGVEGIVSQAMTESGGVQGKAAEAKGHASTAESARDNVVALLADFKEEPKAQTMIQEANTAAANARTWAGQAERSASTAKSEAANAEAKLSSLNARVGQLSNIFSGCNVSSGDSLVAEAKEHQLSAVVHARGAKDNAEAAEKCAQFVTKVASQKQKESEEDGQTAEGGPEEEGKEPKTGSGCDPTDPLGDCYDPTAEKEPIFTAGLDPGVKEEVEKGETEFQGPEKGSSGDGNGGKQPVTTQPGTYTETPEEAGEKEPKEQLPTEHTPGTLEGPSGETMPTWEGQVGQIPQATAKPRPSRPPSKPATTTAQKAPPPKPQIYLVTKKVSGIWHWKSRKCTMTEYQIASSNEEVERIRQAWDTSNKKCKQGCNRGALYARYWYPQSWGVSASGPSAERPALPKKESKCTGAISGPGYQP